MWVEPKYASFSVSWLWMQCDQLLQTLAAVSCLSQWSNYWPKHFLSFSSTSTSIVSVTAIFIIIIYIYGGIVSSGGQRIVLWSWLYLHTILCIEVIEFRLPVLDGKYLLTVVAGLFISWVAFVSSFVPAVCKLRYNANNWKFHTVKALNFV